MNIFEKAYNIKYCMYFLYMSCEFEFDYFHQLRNQKFYKVLACYFEITVFTNFENPSTNP